MSDERKHTVADVAGGGDENVRRTVPPPDDYDSIRESARFPEPPAGSARQATKTLLSRRRRVMESRRVQGVVFALTAVSIFGVGLVAITFAQRGGSERAPETQARPALSIVGSVEPPRENVAAPPPGPASAEPSVPSPPSAPTASPPNARRAVRVTSAHVPAPAANAPLDASAPSVPASPTSKPPPGLEVLQKEL